MRKQLEAELLLASMNCLIIGIYAASTTIPATCILKGHSSSRATNEKELKTSSGTIASLGRGRKSNMTNAYQYPNLDKLLHVEPFERHDYFGSTRKKIRKKIDWLMRFAEEYGITTWKRKDFTSKSAAQLNAIWAKYWRIDKTAAQINLERLIDPSHRQDLDIGQWPNPYLPDEPEPESEPEPTFDQDTKPEELTLF